MINSEQKNENFLYDIYDNIYNDFLKSKIFYLIVFLLISLFLSIIIYFLYKKFKKEKKLNIKESSLKELELLKIKEIKLNKDKIFIYSKLTQIFKNYFSINFKLNLQNNTDSEFIKSLENLINEKKIILENDFFINLKSFLLRAKEIKFSLKDFSNEQKNEDINLIEKFINLTFFP